MQAELRAAAAANPSDRIEYRDRLASHRGQVVDPLLNWIRQGHHAYFALAVFEAIGRRDPRTARKAFDRAIELSPSLAAYINEARARLGWRKEGPVHPPGPPQPRGEFKELLYRAAKSADPEAAGVRADFLWQRVRGLPEAAGHDQASVASTLNKGHDLFDRIHGSGGKFRWLDPPREVLRAADGALSGDALAEEAIVHARRIDRLGRGFHYQLMTRTLLDSGIPVAGVDRGAAVNAALRASPNLFERVGRGQYRLRGRE
jgi:hypothetical protein